jgi:hypothetical protein
MAVGARGPSFEARREERRASKDDGVSAVKEEEFQFSRHAFSIADA